MITKSININLKNDDVARPIALLVQVASQYKSEISIKQDNRTVNAKSIMGMMTLGLVLGKSVEVFANGEDEMDAIKKIEEYLEGN